MNIITTGKFCEIEEQLFALVVVFFAYPAVHGAFYHVTNFAVANKVERAQKYYVALLQFLIRRASFQHVVVADRLIIACAQGQIAGIRHLQFHVKNRGAVFNEHIQAHALCFQRRVNNCTAIKFGINKC